MKLTDEQGQEYEFEYAYNEGNAPYRELGTLKPVGSWPQSVLDSVAYLESIGIDNPGKFERVLKAWQSLERSE